MTFVSVLTTALYILLAIAILLLMVLIHEFGHYVAGRALGFKIEEFSVGFGKAIISRTNKRGEKISLRLFPLGGYCAFAGEEDEKPSKDSFVSQPPWKRIIVFLAGVTFNFLTAIIFSVVFLCAMGYDIPQVNEYSKYNEEIVYNQEGTQYYKIDENSIPEAYRDNWQVLEPDDVIFAVEGVKIDFAYSETFQALMSQQFAKLSAWLDAEPKDGESEHTLSNFGKYGDGSIVMTVRRNGEYLDVHVPLLYTPLTNTDGSLVVNQETGKAVNLILIGFSSKAYKFSFWEALSRCISFSFGLAWVVLKSLWQLLTFQLSITQMGGTITTIATIVGMTQQSLITILGLIPILAANLAVFNALPFPALDGSHVVFTLIEWIRGKPINRKVENIIHTVGIAILFAFVIIVDILHFVLPA